MLIEALADGGVKMGLPRDLAYRLASQTVMGSGLLVNKSGLHPGVLKDNVTSPAGSTARYGNIELQDKPKVLFGIWFFRKWTSSLGKMQFPERSHRRRRSSDRKVS